MSGHIALYTAVTLVVAATVLCFGYLEHKKADKRNSNLAKWKEVLYVGVAKLISMIGVALLSAGAIAVILSIFVKPTPEIVMPAYASNTSFYDWEMVDVVWTETIISESESRLTTNPETAYSDLAHAYFMSRNYDLAIPMLENAYAINQRWEYANDIGICYGYLCDYNQASRYLKLALTLDPPIVARGAIVEAKVMIDSYFSSWFLSLFH